MGVLLDLIYDISGVTSPGLDGSVSMLLEWAYIVASILFALLIVLAFVRQRVVSRTE